MDFNSNHPLTHKRSVVRSLLDRADAVSSNDVVKNAEINRIRSTLVLNNYPKQLVDKNKILNKPKSSSTNKRVVLPYVKGCSERIARILRKYDVGVCYKPFNKLRSIFGLQKDPLEPDQVCGVVYEVPCSDCNKTYIGQTKNSLRTRLQQHCAACRHLQREKSTFAKHSIDLHHPIDWTRAKVVVQAADL